MTIYPFVFHLGPLTITGYGLMMMVAFLMAGWTIQVDLRRRGMNEDYAADIVFAAVIGGIAGARIWYVLLTGAWVALFWRGGCGWSGGRRRRCWPRCARERETWVSGAGSGGPRVGA